MKQKYRITIVPYDTNNCKYVTVESVSMIKAVELVKEMDNVRYIRSVVLQDKDFCPVAYKNANERYGFIK